MARDYDSIERDIEQARNQLANTLDELATRANPKNLVEQGKQSATEVVNRPVVKYSLIGVGVLIVLVVARKLFGGKKK